MMPPPPQVSQSGYIYFVFYECFRMADHPGPTFSGSGTAISAWSSTSIAISIGQWASSENWEPLKLQVQTD